MNANLDIAMVTMLLPFLAVAGLLWLTGRIRERREASIARQIALTDAIHRELGAAAAPEVRRRSREWIVSVRVPLQHEETVAAITRITHDVFRRLDHEDPPRLSVVLRPTAPRPSTRAVALTSPRPAGRLSRAAGAMEEAMDSNAYVVEQLVAVRIAELRAERRRLALLEAAREARPGVVAALGEALIRLGRWLAPAEPARGGNAGVRVSR